MALTGQDYIQGVFKNNSGNELEWGIADKGKEK
jgi:hypothetical protein